jgi:hypothetical protein
MDRFGIFHVPAAIGGLQDPTASRSFVLQTWSRITIHARNIEHAATAPLHVQLLQPAICCAGLSIAGQDHHGDWRH